MIGRKAELGRLRAVLDRAPEAPSALFVTGAPGIGKSTLLEHARALAGDSGYTVLACAGLQSDMPVGFADLHGLLYPVLHVASALPPRQRRALASAFGEESELDGDPLLIRIAILGLLEEIASRGPVALVVDDWQWLDPSTRAVLTFVVQHLVGAGIVLLAGVRIENGEDFVLPGGSVLPVAPLSRAQAEAVVDGLGETLRPRDRDLIIRFAQGNPLALSEFVNAVRAGEPLENSVVFPERLPVSARLERAFASEVAHLPERSRKLLLLAVAGVDITVTELMVAAERIGSDPADLDLLEKSGLLGTAGGRLRFRHPFVRSTVYARASLNERIAAHETLAGAVSDRSRRAWHRAGATIGRDDTIAAELEGAATDLERRGALPEAAAALSRAAELSTDDDERARRLIGAAERARRAGLVDLAVAFLDQARPLTDDPVLRLRLHTVQLWTHVLTSATKPDFQPYLDFARELAARDVDRFDESLLKLLWPMGPLVWLHGDHGPVVAEVVEQVRAVRAPDWNQWQWLLLLVLDPARFADELRPKLPELLAAWDDDPSALPINFAHAVSAMQRVGVAAGVHERVCAILREGGSVADEARHQVAFATARNVTGRPREGLAAAQVAVRICEALNLSMQAAAGYSVQAVSYAWLGDAAASREAFEASERIAPTAWPIVHAHRHWAAGIVALAERRHSDAWAHLTRTAVHRTTYLWAMADLAEAAARSENSADATAALDALRGEVQAYDSPEVTALYERARAVLDETPGAELRFQRALAEGQRSGVQLQLARTHLAYGVWLRRERRVIDARGHLEEACRLFESVGAEQWLEQAASELRASGIRVQRRAEALGVEALTDQETQIALLAAQGLSNKAIADRLYMSHRTVGSHLYRIFPKLGVTHRAQLRDALSLEGGGERPAAAGRVEAARGVQRRVGQQLAAG